MSKVLVTGGAGFIGSHLVDRLIDLRNEVIIVDDLSTGSIENINKKAEFVKRSITEDLEDLFKKHRFDYVFHLAAQINVRKSLENPKADAEVNIGGSLNVIRTASKYNVRKFVFASTGGAIYSRNAKLPANEQELKEPESPYGIAKLTIENYLRVYREVFGLDCVALRFSNVYGPRQNPKGEAGVISIFLDKIAKNEPVKIFGSGDQTRDYVYVKDVVEALVKSLGLEGEFNVSTRKETSVNELASKLKIMANSNIETINVEAIKGELQRSCLCYDKLKSRGWEPKYDLDSGLKETFEWFKQKSL